MTPFAQLNLSSIENVCIEYHVAESDSLTKLVRAADGFIVQIGKIFPDHIIFRIYPLCHMDNNKLTCCPDSLL
jgi:hypothetical protein